MGCFAIYALLFLRYLPFYMGTILFLTLVLSIVTQRFITLRHFLYIGIFSFSLTALFHIVLSLPLPGQPSLILKLTELLSN